MYLFYKIVNNNILNVYFCYKKSICNMLLKIFVNVIDKKSFEVHICCIDKKKYLYRTTK